MLLQAVERNPSDSLPWYELVQTELALHDTRGAVLAAQRVVALDPEGQTAKAIIRAGLLSAPPGDSATATSTRQAGK